MGYIPLRDLRQRSLAWLYERIEAETDSGGKSALVERIQSELAVSSPQVSEGLRALDMLLSFDRLTADRKAQFKGEMGFKTVSAIPGLYKLAIRVREVDPSGTVAVFRKFLKKLQKVSRV